MKKSKQIKFNIDPLDKQFNRIINSSNSLLSKETLLSDYYSNYKDYIVGDIELNRRKIIKEKKALKKSKQKHHVEKSEVTGVYYNSIKKMYCILLPTDESNVQQHFGFYKTKEKAERICLELKEKYNIKK